MEERNGGAGAVLGVLRQKMQTQKEELEQYRDMYDEKCRQVEILREIKNEVGSCSLIVIVMSKFLQESQDPEISENQNLGNLLITGASSSSS